MSSNGAGSNGKGKGRAQPRDGGMRRPRRAADYTPAKVERVDQAIVKENARVAAERAEEAEAAAAAERLAAEGGNADGAEEDGVGLDEEPEACYICAEPIKYFVLGPCSHRTCHVCSLRLRALYKKRECTFCKLDLPNVICTTDPFTPFQDFPPDTFSCSDAKLGLACETTDMLSDTLALLHFNCPLLHCDYVGSGWADLKKHARSVHEKQFCDLCTRNKKIFAHEHTLYTQHDLATHIKEGDPLPSSSTASEYTGFSGHPACEFCRTTFYDSDQLFEHCRDKHEQCFICIRNGTGRYQYYVDYAHLETHFQSQHYLCLNPQCLDQRFTVFDSEIDLKAHQLSEHGATVGGGGGQGSGRNAVSRRVETNFTYATPSGSSRDPRAGGGQTMNAQPRRQQRPAQQIERPSAPIEAAAVQASVRMAEAALPGGSSQPNGVMNSRGRVVPGLQRGGFNTSLSSDLHEPNPNSKKSRNPTRDISTMSESVTGVQQVDSVMAARHASLLSRVSEAVDGSENRMTAFRTAIRAFRNNESSALDCIRTLFALFSNQADLTGRIVSSVSDLLDSPSKSSDLLQAWHDFELTDVHSAVDNFPSLVPTAPTAFGSSSVSLANGRSRSSSVKNQTAFRTSKQGNNDIWARVESAAANKNVGAVPGLTPRAAANANKFPALPTASTSKNPHAVSATAGVRGATPWASTRTKAASPGSVYFPKVASTTQNPTISTGLTSRPGATAVSTSRSSNGRTGGADFPGLPTSTVAQQRSAQRAAIFGRTNSGNGASGVPGTIEENKPWGAASPPLFPGSNDNDDMSSQDRDAVQQALKELSLEDQSKQQHQQQQQQAAKKKKGKQILFRHGL